MSARSDGLPNVTTANRSRSFVPICHMWSGSIPAVRNWRFICRVEEISGPFKLSNQQIEPNLADMAAKILRFQTDSVASMKRPAGARWSGRAVPMGRRAATMRDTRYRYDGALFRQAWQDFRTHQEFEHLLIDRKTSWLLATQGLLFATYGITINAMHRGGNAPQAVEKFATILPWVGLLISAITWFGVVAVISGKYRAWKDYRELLRTRPAFLPAASWKGNDDMPGLQWGVRSWRTWVSLGPDLLLPLVFVSIWAIIGIDIDA